MILGISLITGTAAAQSIGWCNVQWPLTYEGSSCSGEGIYGQVWIDGVTSSPGATPGLTAQLGFGPVGSTPDETWLWIDAAFNVDAGNNDEFVVFLSYFIDIGSYDYLYRYHYEGDTGWTYGDTDGSGNGINAPGAATITDACGTVAQESISWTALKALYR
jgi:hypothetical protein